MIKRIFDIFLSSFGIIISSPLWILFGLFILIEDGRPILYFQERVGKKGEIFKVLKFRSMIKGAEDEIGPVQAKENDFRVTSVGRILRATAMDELPQLINILKGDMSFIGPRALRPGEIEIGNWKLETGKQEAENRNSDKVDCDKIIPLEKIPGYEGRQSVRPGLTGIAQIYLPTDAPRRKKFGYDLLYVKKQSFWLDLKLIFLSFWITFRGKWESREKKL